MLEPIGGPGIAFKDVLHILVSDGQDVAVPLEAMGGCRPPAKLPGQLMQWRCQQIVVCKGIRALQSPC